MEDPRPRIIRAGTMAPSGDNSQPWSFTLSGDGIVVHMHPEKDHALLNAEDGGTLIASGAAIENMLWEARALKREPSLELMPGPGKNDVARITIAEGRGDAAADTLSGAIPERHTNRRPYKKEALPEDFSRTLARIKDEYAPCGLVILSEPESISEAARAASTMEAVALQDERLHRLFFDSITWSQEEHEAGAPGLHIRTLELPPPVRLLFRALRRWGVVSALNLIGFANLAAQGNAQVYASSGAIVAILAPDRSPRTMLLAGRLAQRVWLEATCITLAAQPLAGLVYLAAALEKDARLVNDTLAASVRAADAKLHDLCGARGEVIAMMLRIGIPLGPATDRSRRRAPLVR